MRIWLATVIGSALFVAALWWTSIPLGIHGEWVWERSVSEADLVWNLCGGIVAIAIVVAFVVQGWRRLDDSENGRRTGIEVTAWLIGLTTISFGWFWIVQELSPIKCRLGKAAFVLYYSSSSGYFTRARYIAPNAGELLAGYEDLMREGDVLHTGTHPPGLFLIFHGLISVCESSPQLSALLDATQTYSFREACDVIAANNLRRTIPRPLLPTDRRILWLATLLSMLAASLVTIPLYMLLRRTVSGSTAWVCAALCSSIPAIAIFIPKSDAVFPLIGVAFLWVWLTAWDRRSIILGIVAGAVSWCGLFCSLAFLPVFMVAAVMTVGSVGFSLNRHADFRQTRKRGLIGQNWAIVETKAPGLREDAPDPATHALSGDKAQLSSDDFSLAPEPVIGIRRWVCILAAGLGFAIPTLLLFLFARINLLNVWRLNYQNHAGFYRHYSRTYWKWLLANPLELSFAVGWPVTLLAIIACGRIIRGFRVQPDLKAKADLWKVVGPVVIVWGLLWITGKNSGEAARIWILFIPWLIWIAGIQFESMLTTDLSFRVRQRQVVAMLAIQYIVCLLTTARVSGFHFETG